MTDWAIACTDDAQLKKGIVITAKLLKYMVDNNISSAIVNAKEPKKITAILAAYNRSNDIEIMLKQKRMIIVSPEDTTCRECWQILIIGLRNNPKTKLKRGRKPKNQFRGVTKKVNKEAK